MADDLSLLSLEELEALSRDAGRAVEGTPAGSAFYNFKPFSWQRPWYDSRASYEFIFAGNRTGKSTCLLIQAITEATGVKPAIFGGYAQRYWPRGNCKHKLIILASETEDSLERNITSKLRKLVTPEMVEPRTNFYSVKKPWKFVSGALLYFATYNQAPAAVEGSAWHFIGLDEPPPKKFFTAITRGAIDHSARVVLAATPLSEPWLLDDMILPSQDSGHPLYGHVDHFTAAMHDNCATCHPGDGCLSHEEIVMKLSTFPAQERAAREFGKFSSLIGLEFDYFDPETHVVPDFDIPLRWPLVEVVDPAMKRGLYVMWFICDPDEQWYAVRAKHIQGDLGFKGMAAQLDYHRGRIGKVPDYAMMDARGGMHLANVDTRETWFDLFRKQGLRYEPAPAEQDQTALLHDWLKPRAWQSGGNQTPRLRFFRSVTAEERGPVWGLKRFVWNPSDSKKRRYDQPGKDWIDDMSYLVTAVEQRNLTFVRYAASDDRDSRRSIATTYASNARMMGAGGRLRLGLKRLADTYGQKAGWVERIERGY